MVAVLWHSEWSAVSSHDQATGLEADFDDLTLAIDGRFFSLLNVRRLKSEITSIGSIRFARFYSWDPDLNYDSMELGDSPVASAHCHVNKWPATRNVLS